MQQLKYMRIVGVLFGFLLVLNLSGQSFDYKQYGGVPIGVVLKDSVSSIEELPIVDLEKIDINREINLDENVYQTPRFACSTALNESFLNNAHKTELRLGSVLYRKRLKTAGELGTALIFENYRLPKGARLYIYNKELSHFIGAYTSESASQDLKLMTEFLHGESLVIELYLPKGVNMEHDLLITRAYTVFRKEAINYTSMTTGYGTSYICNVNSNCPESLPYGDVKKGVVRIQTVFLEGVAWCSGSLMNNTAQDQRPYILTAFHCQDGFTPYYDMWKFYFKYEVPNCNNEPTAPVGCFLEGCYLRSGRAESDFLLVEIDSYVPPAANAVMNGWDRRDSYVPDSTALISHPNGDVKKIAIDYDPVVIHPNIITWNNGINTPPDHHLRGFIDVGTQQPGSSGGPLFDLNHRVLGQLHGGGIDTNCVSTRAYYGRLNKSWDEGVDSTDRLMDWLDPGNTGQTTIDLLDISGSSYFYTGQIKTPNGLAMPNVEIVVSGDLNTTLYTDANGNYSIGPLNGTDVITVEFHKNTGITNGLSAVDILLSQKNINGLIPFTDPIKVLASDVNNSGGPTALDLLTLRKVVSLLQFSFPSTESWGFMPNAISVNVNTGTSNIVGFKFGDVNFTADPNQ